MSCEKLPIGPVSQIRPRLYVSFQFSQGQLRPACQHSVEPTSTGNRGQVRETGQEPDSSDTVEVRGHRGRSMPKPRFLTFSIFRAAIGFISGQFIDIRDPV